MRRGPFVLVLALALAAMTATFLWPPKEPGPEHRPRDVAPVEPTPITPWRNSRQDLAALFPHATQVVLEPRIVSGWTAPIQKRLGRLMHPDENPLRVQRVLEDGGIAGSILVTRVKAEHGGIEIVIGVETNSAVRGVLVQQQRETPEIAAAVTNAAWLKSFAGKTADAAFRVGEDLGDAPAPARASAQAIATGVRDQLIVLSFAARAAAPPAQPSHH